MDTLESIQRLALAVYRFNHGPTLPKRGRPLSGECFECGEDRSGAKCPVCDTIQPIRSGYAYGGPDRTSGYVWAVYEAWALDTRLKAVGRNLSYATGLWASSRGPGAGFSGAPSIFTRYPKRGRVLVLQHTGMDV